MSLEFAGAISRAVRRETLPLVASTEERIEQVRAGMLAEAREYDYEPVDRIVDVDAGGVPARLYLPTRATRALLYLHGGGFVYGALGTHDAHTRRIANRTRSAVLGVGYRKAPEHPFPTGLTDSDRAATWLRDHATAHGLEPGRMVAVGDSAGAALAQAVTLRHPGWFAAQVLAYPFLDPEGTTYDVRVDSPQLSPAEAAWYWSQYAPDPSTHADPALDPLRAPDFSRQPPTLIQLAELDILARTGRELARRMAADGVVPEVVDYPGVPHGFWRRTERYPEAGRSLLDIAAFLDRVVPAAAPVPARAR